MKLFLYTFFTSSSINSNERRGIGASHGAIITINSAVVYIENCDILKIIDAAPKSTHEATGDLPR